MSNRLSCLMTVFNEASFVDYAIRACLPYVDDLVIVEGSYLEAVKLGQPLRSNDGTIDIIEKYRNNSKVTIIYANEQSDTQQRNVGLSAIKKINPDGWCQIVDGDELYESGTFSIIKSTAKLMEKQDKYAAYFTSITFVNDLEHYCNQSFPRLFKLTPECKFVNDNFMEWPDKNLQWSLPSNYTSVYHVISIPNIKFLHFAFCKGQKRFLEKRNWWQNRGFGPNFDYGWHIDKDGKINDTNHKIYKYESKFPNIIKDHPLFKK